ncbi:hypothetical protein PR048_028758 [Dryococelus australis]|uniref:Uncharacterized protein n=1 Tax=Dryococelus australis TaxID=614101 RepID=A0ABQ9GBF7_9NEOP|nr:hypothetical protein PR048_028758 [Dryococelus australis]
MAFVTHLFTYRWRSDARLNSRVYKYSDISCTLVVCCHGGRRRLGQRSPGGVKHLVDQWRNIIDGSTVCIAGVRTSLYCEYCFRCVRANHRRAVLKLPNSDWPAEKEDIFSERKASNKENKNAGTAFALASLPIEFQLFRRFAGVLNTFTMASPGSTKRDETRRDRPKRSVRDVHTPPDSEAFTPRLVQCIAVGAYDGMSHCTNLRAVTTETLHALRVGVRVSAGRIASSLLDIGRVKEGVHPTLKMDCTLLPWACRWISDQLRTSGLSSSVGRKFLRAPPWRGSAGALRATQEPHRLYVYNLFTVPSHFPEVLLKFIFQDIPPPPLLRIRVDLLLSNPVSSDHNTSEYGSHTCSHITKLPAFTQAVGSDVTSARKLTRPARWPAECDDSSSCRTPTKHAEKELEESRYPELLLETTLVVTPSNGAAHPGLRRNTIQTTESSTKATYAPQFIKVCRGPSRRGSSRLFTRGGGGPCRTIPLIGEFSHLLSPTLHSGAAQYSIHFTFSGLYHPGAVVVYWLDYRLPPRRTGFDSRRSRPPPPPDIRMWESCRWSAGVLGNTPFPSPFRPRLLHANLTSPTLALKTSLLRASQITSLTHVSTTPNNIRHSEAVGNDTARAQLVSVEGLHGRRHEGKDKGRSGAICPGFSSLVAVPASSDLSTHASLVAIAVLGTTEREQKHAPSYFLNPASRVRLPTYLRIRELRYSDIIIIIINNIVIITTTTELNSRTWRRSCFSPIASRDEAYLAVDRDCADALANGGNSLFQSTHLKHEEHITSFALAAMKLALLTIYLQRSHQEQSNEPKLESILLTAEEFPREDMPGCNISDTGDKNTRDQRPVAPTRKALNLRAVLPLPLFPAQMRSVTRTDIKPAGLHSVRSGRCRWSASFLGDLPLPSPFHSGAVPYSPQSPSSVLKTSMLRAAEISSPTHYDMFIDSYRFVESVCIIPFKLISLPVGDSLSGRHEPRPTSILRLEHASSRESEVQTATCTLANRTAEAPRKRAGGSSSVFIKLSGSARCDSQPRGADMCKFGRGKLRSTSASNLPRSPRRSRKLLFRGLQPCFSRGNVWLREFEVAGASLDESDEPVKGLEHAEPSAELTAESGVDVDEDEDKDGATSCGYNSSHPVGHALYECLQDIHGDSSPFLLQPFHESRNGFWPCLTNSHLAIQFVPKMFRCSIGLRSELWAGQFNLRTLSLTYPCMVALETWHHCHPGSNTGPFHKNATVLGAFHCPECYNRALCSCYHGKNRQSYAEGHETALHHHSTATEFLSWHYSHWQKPYTG